MRTEKIFQIIFLILMFVFFANAVVAETVKSFSEMENIEEYEELKEYGLLPPDQYNHKAGSNLILMAIKANNFSKGDWAMAHGLLGASMLNVSLNDRSGYQNLFLSSCDNSKIYNSAENKNAWLFSTKYKPVETKSIITKRENIIALMAYTINERYIFSRGTWGRVYRPDINRPSNEILFKYSQRGLEVYTDLLKKGINDKCLKNTLGITYASLNFDKFKIFEILGNSLKLKFPLQIYSDALEATINKLKQMPNHSLHFLSQLSLEMGSRGISDADTFLFPDNEKEHEMLLKFIKDDLLKIDLANKANIK